MFPPGEAGREPWPRMPKPTTGTPVPLTARLRALAPWLHAAPVGQRRDRAAGVAALADPLQADSPEVGKAE